MAINMSFLDKARPVEQTPSAPALSFASKIRTKPVKENNMLQKFAQNVLVRPGVRVGEALGAGIIKGIEAFQSPEKRAITEANFQNALRKDIKTPIFGTTAGIKAFGEGGGKQIALEGGKSAFDIGTLGVGGVANKGIQTGVRALGGKVLPQAVKNLSETKVGGFLARQLPKTVANITEGVGYNVGYNVLNEKKPFENTGVAAGLSFGLPIVFGATGKVFNKVRDLKNISKNIDTLEQKYTEWTTGTKPGKKLVNAVTKKTEMLNLAGTQGKTPMRTLAESGIIPETKGVKFNTFNQAESYRDSITPLREANRDALQEAGLSTIATSIDDLERQAIEFARTPANINAGRASKMEKEIRDEFNLLRREYPTGKLPLSVQDDIKSARWDNVFKNKGLIDADILKKDSEYAIAKSLQKNIEEVANQAGHTEVAQLNREIGDRLEAAKFLESLDGKVLKGGRLGKYVGTLLGASMGNSIPGKILGAIGGNMVADILIKTSVSSPIRRVILSKLEKTDPEAYVQTIKWLTKQDELRRNRLLLPKGSTILGGKNQLGQNIDESGNIISPPQGKVELLPAGKYPTSINPKTGKFQRVYSSGQLKSPNAQQTNPAITNVAKNPISPSIPEAPKKSRPNMNAGFISTPYRETGNLTTKILKDLEGKTTVSKQYIQDLAGVDSKTGLVKEMLPVGIKKPEAELFAQILKNEGDKVNIPEFAQKVKAELLPLKVMSTKGGYEARNLEPELRGNVAKYAEHTWESPIKTSAGEKHPGLGGSKNYFGHTRIEDMADNKTRRVIEVQSDLYQKGNLQNEGGTSIGTGANKAAAELEAKRNPDSFAAKEVARAKEIAKLQQYNDPTAHFRMIREEIKKAAQDGKTKLQFPTGETVMKIEGLGSENAWQINTWDDNAGRMNTVDLTPDKLKVGMEVDQQYGDSWIITDVLGDGKFKAVPKDRMEYYFGKNLSDYIDDFKDGNSAGVFEGTDLATTQETFDISGKVDTSNPIYKFYEKDVQKYLNKFGGKRIVDDKGVSWIEVPIKKEYAKQPVDAFGKLKTGALLPIAGATALGALGAGALKRKNDNGR